MKTQNYIHATVLAIVLASIIHEGILLFFNQQYVFNFISFNFFIFKFISFFSGTSIICYECNSISNPDCANDVKNIQPIDCSNKTDGFPISNFRTSKTGKYNFPTFKNI